MLITSVFKVATSSNKSTTSVFNPIMVATSVCKVATSVSSAVISVCIVAIFVNAVSYPIIFKLLFIKSNCAVFKSNESLSFAISNPLSKNEGFI